MGDYSDRLSERIQHANTKNRLGYCLICDHFGPLTYDHVPPRSAVTITKVEQFHVMEKLGIGEKKLKGSVSNNGSKFKTICAPCNSLIGRCDGHLGEVSRHLSNEVVNYFNDINRLYRSVTARCDGIKIARAVAGHVLSATSAQDCQTEPVESSFFDPLKRFVLTEVPPIETHEFYYWFYPYRKHVSAKAFAFYNQGHLAIMSLLAYFPIAFLITETEKSIFPVHAKKLEINAASSMTLDLSAQGIEYSAFPFIPLVGNQMVTLSAHQAIVSYPIK